MKSVQTTLKGKLRDARDRWVDALNHQGFRRRMGLSIIFLWGVMAFFTRFLLFVEARPGALISDPVLAAFTPLDLTWVTFGFMYGALGIALGTLTLYPEKIMGAMQTYALMVCVRIVMMFSLPLDPPALMIPLQDPFVEWFGTGQLLTRDLFFSGHTATMVLIFLLVPVKKFRPFLGLAALMVASGVLLQHVHYTVDVLVAPFVAWVAYRVVQACPKLWTWN